MKRKLQIRTLIISDTPAMVQVKTWRSVAAHPNLGTHSLLV